MGTKPLHLLLDACTVIRAYKADRWEALITRCAVSIPSTVIHFEVKYFEDTADRQHRVFLSEFVDLGRVRQVEASQIELNDALQSLGPTRDLFMLGKGEHEALALMLSGGLPEHFFCTSDGPAIQAAVVLGLRERLISLEEVLERIGQSASLHSSCVKKFVEHHSLRGTQLRIRYGMST